MTIHTEITAPELFPHSGNDKPALMRRLAVYCDVQRVAQSIWSYPAAKPRTGYTDNLDCWVSYYLEARGMSPERIDAVHEFIARFVPGGGEADVRAFDREERRSMMKICRIAAKAGETNIRRKISLAAD